MRHWYGLQGRPDSTGDSQVESAEDVWSELLTWSALLLVVWGAPRSSAGVLLAAHCQTLSSSSCIDTAVFNLTNSCNVHRYIENVYRSSISEVLLHGDQMSGVSVTRAGTSPQMRRHFKISHSAMKISMVQAKLLGEHGLAHQGCDRWN